MATCSAAAGFRLVGIDRKGLVVAPARVRDIVDATAQGSPAPAIDNVEGERRMDVDRRMQRRRQVPGLVAHAGDEFALPAGRAERHAASVAGDDVAAFVQSLHLDLQTLDRGIDDAHRAAGHSFFAQHIPGLERGLF